MIRRDAIDVGSRIATEPGDTLEQVRAKERALAHLHSDGAPLAAVEGRVPTCGAGWFGEHGWRRASVPFGALADEILGRGRLPDHVAAPLVAEPAAIAARERFFHWTLEFPEVFHDASGEPLPTPGSTPSIGNPPWEMLRGDRGDAGARDAARTAAANLTHFARSSGVYTRAG